MSDNAKGTDVAPLTEITRNIDDVVPGDIILADFPYVRPSYDRNGKKIFSKPRPALVLYVKSRQMAVAYISSRLPILLDSADVLVMRTSASFERTGLKESSVIKLGVLATIPFEKAIGLIGSVDDALRDEINAKIAACIKV